MAKHARNRGMYFGSWTGEDIAESATVNIGDSTGVKGCEVNASTFGKAVKSLSDEYNFLYDGKTWTLNGVTVNDIETTYGLTISGEPAENDILVVLYQAKTGAWEAIGKDNDDLGKELNPDTETSKNVLGESTFNHSGYEPQVDVDPYYMDPARKMYKHLRDVAIQEKYAEADLLGWFAEAYFDTANPNTGIMTGEAFVRRAWFVPKSTGGQTSGQAIPYTINPVGSPVRKKIVYDMATNESTITDFE